MALGLKLPGSDLVLYQKTSGGGGGGDDGWTPILAVVSDGERRVLQVVDWTGGTGTKPATGLYVGATGLEVDITDGVDIRGAAGANGTNGWSPILAIVSDDERRVLQVTDWTGGTGTKPTTGLYVGIDGLKVDIADGVDIRGPQGDSGTTTPYETLTESTTSRVLALTDASKYIRLTNGSSCEITIPNQATVVWLADTEIVFRVAAAGIPTITLGAGVTLNDPNNVVAGLVQGDTFAIKRVAENVWDLI